MMKENKNIKTSKHDIILISHHRMIKDWFQNFCKDNPEYIIQKNYSNIQSIDKAEYSKSKFIIVLCTTCNPDLVKNPHDNISRLKSIFPEGKILMINTNISDDEKITLLKLGIKGFFSKEFIKGDMKKAFKEILNDQLWIKRSLANKLISYQLKEKKDIYKDPKNAYNLSNREIEVLQSITSGLSNKEISDELYISEKTVKSHLSKIFKKMNVKSRTQASVKAISEKIV